MSSVNWNASQPFIRHSKPDPNELLPKLNRDVGIDFNAFQKLTGAVDNYSTFESSDFQAVCSGGNNFPVPASVDTFKANAWNGPAITDELQKLWGQFDQTWQNILYLGGG